jgi:hypothetical protein
VANVDLQLIDGLGLPYAPGAEVGLRDPTLDPAFDGAWQGFLALFPGQTLLPLFDELRVDELADRVDGVRVDGGDPPDPFVWFTLTCDDAVVDDVVAALIALPMVVVAGVDRFRFCLKRSRMARIREPRPDTRGRSGLRRWAQMRFTSGRFPVVR